jgi:hypothetical protein
VDDGDQLADEERQRRPVDVTRKSTIERIICELGEAESWERLAQRAERGPISRCAADET